MNKILILHFRGTEQRTESISLLGRDIAVEHIGCDKDLDVMAAHIKDYDGKVDAIGLQGIARQLRLAKERIDHTHAGKLFEITKTTPVVDGSGVRDAMERWAIRLAAEKQPGIWSRKHVLMVPGLNHGGLVRALNQYCEELRYADPILYFALPDAPFLGSAGALDKVAGFTLNQMADGSFRILFPSAGKPGVARAEAPFKWADVIAGDIGAIRRYGPQELKRKIIVTQAVNDEDLADLKARGVATVVTTMPPLSTGSMSNHSAETFEACLVSLRPDKEAELNENTYLNLMADLDWQPGITHLSEDASTNLFAFVIHPLSLKFIHTAPGFKWTRFLPDRLVEWGAAYIPPTVVSRITGVVSPATGQKVEGILLIIGGTPRELMRRDPNFVYKKLVKAAQISERMGARLMGLGAFTSVVGDAGITVDQQSDIAITSGNSLTVAATLETARQAMEKMGHKPEDVAQANCMIIGATGSIGSVCSRVLAQTIPNITLVAPRPEKLIDLKRTIEAETPGTTVKISTSADPYVGEADLIVTTTTAIGQRIIDISLCKPGAIVCDIARPADITAEEAILRPDVLVIESGEILLPGKPDFGYNIGLPPGVAYACLSETALLALEGRFESFTLGRNIQIEPVKEIHRLYEKHGLQLSGIRSHGHFLQDEDLLAISKRAAALRDDPERLKQVRAAAAAGLRAIDAAKGQGGPKTKKKKTDKKTIAAAGAAGGAVAGLFGWKLFKRRKS